jgi:hypothetical protein
MVKALTYINPSGKAVLLPLLLLLTLCFPVGGRGQEAPTVTIDSTMIIEEPIGVDEATRFEAVTTEDRQPVRLRQVDSQRLDKLKKDDAFWYVNTAPVKAKKQVIKKLPEPRQNPEWVRNLLWVLVVGGFVTLIIWFLMASDVQLFWKSPPVVAKQEDEEEFSTENLFDIDYESALKSAMAAGNYRLAIRLLYLQTLRDLALRNIIQYRQERTNSDYLMQLFHTSYYKDFFRLTRNFEYAWYGQFEVSPSAFERIRNEFASFKQRMPS